MNWKQIILDILGIEPEIRYKEKIIWKERKPSPIIEPSSIPALSQIRNFPKQKHKVLFKASEVREIVKDQVGPKGDIEINDSLYYGVNLDSYYKFAEWFGIDDMKWMPNIEGDESEEELKEYFGDCNVFGHGLKGVTGLWDSTLAMAECLGYFNGGGYHFSNLIITEMGEVLRFEPQTNAWETLNHDDKIKDVRF